MRSIPLSKGFTAIVDDEDYEALAQFRWWATVDGRRAYAVREEGCSKIYMHRVIMKAGQGVKVDHRRHSIKEMIVDNRRCNLRLASDSENGANRGKGFGRNASVFKGVSRARRQRWRAAIERGDTSLYLGGFYNEGYAALAYDLAAVRLYGEFAVTNFPVPGSTQWLFGPKK